jgi:hypothetical protein
MATEVRKAFKVSKIKIISREEPGFDIKAIRISQAYRFPVFCFCKERQ